MTEREFIYWLQGFLELEDPKAISERQVEIIKDHIKLVLTKVTPDRAEDLQEKLKKLRAPASQPPSSTRRYC